MTRDTFKAKGTPPPASETKTLPVPTRVYLIGETAVIAGHPQRGWDEDGPDAHNCDDMGCPTFGWHVLARVPFADERAEQTAADCTCPHQDAREPYHDVACPARLAQQPVGDGPIDANSNAEYIEHCADVLERRGLRVTAGALRVIAQEHRTLSQQAAAERVDVRKLVALAEQMERDAAGCRRDGYIDAAVVKEDCAYRIRQTLGISAIAEALAAEGVQAEEADQRARELLEAECGRPLPLDVPVCAALSAVVAALTAAQQQGKPAAVDEAMVERATMALLGKSHDTAPGIDWRCDRAWTVNKVRKHMRAALTAALAAKHQGGSDDA